MLKMPLYVTKIENIYIYESVVDLQRDKLVIYLKQVSLSLFVRVRVCVCLLRKR